MGIRLRSALAFAAVALAPALARADLQHTVARGHTVEAIANRYRVSVKSILDANHITDPKRLRAGDVLTIPGRDAPKGANDEKKQPAKKDAKAAKVAKPKKVEPPTYAMKPKTPGVVHLSRAATGEQRDIRIADKKSRVSASAAKAFETLLRSPAGMSHPIEPRLVTVLGVISNHFGSRKIEIVSGFRPYTPTQYTAHSNHNHGKAVDFRILGVPNDVVRDFCRTLKKVGCGYYPNSPFVHVDVREASAFWIDYAKPGEPPRYNAADVAADEGISDVNDDGRAATAAPPSEPFEPLPAPAKAETEDGKVDDGAAAEGEPSGD